MEKKHGISLGEHRKELDELIRQSIEQIEKDQTASSNGKLANKSSPVIKSTPSPGPVDTSISDDENDIYSG
jgi:hypothetical protein